MCSLPGRKSFIALRKCVQSQQWNRRHYIFGGGKCNLIDLCSYCTLISSVFDSHEMPFEVLEELRRKKVPAWCH